MATFSSDHQEGKGDVGTSASLLLQSQANNFPIFHGIVSRWMRTHGFINTGNNESIFGHASNVKWKDNRKKITLRPGMQVSFKVSKGSSGKPEAFNITGRKGQALDFHEKFGDTDPYDRDIQFDGAIFRGTIKFFDSRQLYGKVVLKDSLPEHEHSHRLKPEDIFFKAVDALGEEYPFKIRRERECTFKMYYSEKYGWGAFDVMDGDVNPWPSYKASKISNRKRLARKNEITDMPKKQTIFPQGDTYL